MDLVYHCWRLDVDDWGRRRLDDIVDDWCLLLGNGNLYLCWGDVDDRCLLLRYCYLDLCRLDVDDWVDFVMDFCRWQIDGVMYLRYSLF